MEKNELKFVSRAETYVLSTETDANLEDIARTFDQKAFQKFDFYEDMKQLDKNCFRGTYKSPEGDYYEVRFKRKIIDLK